jgi:DNA-binding MarR family transcriptional regulator
MAPPATHERDRVDELVEWWCATHPDVDPDVKQLGIRLRRAAHAHERILRRELAASDTELWEFEVLISLYRADDHCRCAGDLQREAQLTSGAITNRVGILEQRGWVRRDTNPADRRQVLVSLTDDGLARAKELLAIKTSTDAALFGRLDPDLRRRLIDGLRALLGVLEEDGDTTG